jgi:putative ABC transport system permease protein
VVDVARRNLFQEKLRFIISAGGVALAIMLMVILNGFFAGMNRQVSAYLDNTPVDLVLSQKKVKNFLGASSRVPLRDGLKVEKTAGVRKVIPIFSSYTVLELGGRREFSLLIGFDPSKGGGPWRIVEGTKNINDDEVIFDKLVADRHGYKLGRRVRILGKDFKIAGLSSGTSSWMTGTFFVTFKAASRLLAAGDSTGFLLVTASDGTKINELESRLSSDFPDLSVTTKTERAKNDVALYAGVFNKPLLVMVIIAFLIGVMLVGATIYTATVERAREYGMMKAVGARNSKLYGVVFEQALIVAVVGFILGVVLSFLAKFVIAGFAPQFFVLIEWPYLVFVALIALLIGIVASYIPVRTIAGIDPAIAFKRGA